MSHTKYWAGKGGYYGSKLNLFRELTGVDLGHILFDRLSQADGPITGPRSAELHATVAPMPYSELGPLKTIIDQHYNMSKPVSWETVHDKVNALHLRGRIGEQSAASIPGAIRKVMNASTRPVIVVGSGESVPIIETLMDDNILASNKLLGIALNGHSVKHNQNVMYVRDTHDQPSAVTNTLDHDYLEYYKD